MKTIFIIATIAMFVCAAYAWFMFYRSVDNDLDVVATVAALEAFGFAAIMTYTRFAMF